MIDVLLLGLLTLLGAALGACAALVWLQRPCPRCAILDATPPEPALPPPISFFTPDEDKTPVHKHRYLPRAAYRDQYTRTTIDMRAPRLDDDDD